MGETIVMGLVAFASFYFILLRPVLQQQKKRRRDISHLNIGDEVLTTGGFYAVVRDIRTSERGPVELRLEAAPGVELRATADAVASVTRAAEAGAPSLILSPEGLRPEALGDGGGENPGTSLTAAGESLRPEGGPHLTSPTAPGFARLGERDRSPEGGGDDVSHQAGGA
jgi:preprotein translocase YajC subunit